MAITLDGTTGITVSGNITGNNISASGTLSVGSFAPSSLNVAGNVAGGNVTTSGVFAGSGVQLTNIPGANVTGNVPSANVSTRVRVSGAGGQYAVGLLSDFSGNVLAAAINTIFIDTSVNGGALYAGALLSGNIGNTTSIINGNTITATGNITGGNLSVSTGTISCGNIVNSNANGVGNIGTSLLYFNTAFVKATSAQYADLAEMYVADANYQPGTVLEFGGNYEVTATTESHSTKVAGIVSTNPSYLMNATQEGEYVVAVALTGRVPCRVQGPVRKGDVLVSSDTPGVAQRIGVNYQPGCTVGKAMEIIETNEICVIEVAVGRL